MLGRCHRFIGKFVGDRETNVRMAEEAFRRALALSPNLSAAHRFLTHLEAEAGRADSAIARLLEQARARRNDPHLFAGLVHACRYAGLIDESLAAHAEARRLDPNITTSIEYTYALSDDPAMHARLDPQDPHSQDKHAAVLAALFRRPTPSVGEVMRELERGTLPPGFQVAYEAMHAVAFGTRDEALAALAAAVAAHDDPEALFIFSLGYAKLGEREIGLPLLAQVVRSGYSPAAMIEHDPVFDRFRDDPLFATVVADARARVATARLIFDRGGGRPLLGLPRAS